MNPPSATYSGDGAHVFVCYSHEDKELVYEQIAWLQTNKINVWYDQGIVPGHEWTQEVAAAIEDSSQLLYFVTPASVETRHCRNEVHYAQEHAKQVIAVHLEPTKLPAGLQLSMSSVQALFRYQMDPGTYGERLLQALSGPPVPSIRARMSPQAELIEKLYSSIAVFPLDNLADDPEMDSLGVAIAEDVTESLARLGYISGGLRLIGHRETTRLKSKSATEIARALDVGGVLRGTLRRTGENARIAVELANAGGEHVWTQTFNVTLPTLTEVPDHLIDMIVHGFLAAIERYGPDRAVDIPAEYLGPIGLLLKADATVQGGTPNAQQRAREMMERAIALNPNLPLLKAALANRMAFIVAYGRTDDREDDRRRAIELAEDCSSSESAIVLMHAGLSFSALCQHDRAVAICRLAHEMAPRFVSIARVLAGALLYSGEPSEALAIYRDLERRATSGQRSQVSTGLAQCLLATGDIDGALETAQRAIGQGVHDINLYLTIANALAKTGRISEAMETVERIRAFVPRFTIAKSIRAFRRQMGSAETADAMTQGLQILIERGYD